MAKDLQTKFGQPNHIAEKYAPKTQWNYCINSNLSKIERTRNLGLRLQAKSLKPSSTTNISVWHEFSTSTTLSNLYFAAKGEVDN